MTHERWQLSKMGAESYERFQVPIIIGPLTRIFLAHVPIEPGQRLLDVACGTGIIAREAAYMVGTKGSITGVDLNADMLDIARMQTPNSSTTLQWHKGDAEDLPFPDASFDVALCQQGLQFFPNKLIALKEMYRVLETGGLVGICAWQGIGHSPCHLEIAKALRHHVSNRAAEQIEAQFAFGDANALFELMSEAGFVDTEMWSAVETIRMQSPEISIPDLLAGTPAASMFLELDDISRKALIDDISAALEPYRTEDGLSVPQATHIALAKKRSGNVSVSGSD